MKFDIEFSGNKYTVRPELVLYNSKDCYGTPAFNLGLRLLTDNGVFATLTTNFGDFIGIKNTAYVDTNNCPNIIEQLVEMGYAHYAECSRHSGYCTYPLYFFSPDFLKECGAETYQLYLDCYKRLVEDKLG